MTNEFQHLLTKHGVLVAFNISKRISKSYLTNLKNKLKKEGKTEKEIDDEITTKISEQTKLFMMKHEIPGLCEDMDDNAIITLDPHMKDLIFKLTDNSCNFCEKNKFTKDHMILFIQLFFNMMKISNDDVLDFKERFGLLDDSDDEDSDDEDSDEEL